MNIFSLLLQLAVEIVRTVFIDELSEKLRRLGARWSFRYGHKKLNIADRIHLRVRSRLFHRLTTGEQRKL